MERHLMTIFLLLATSGAFAGNPVKWLLTSADSLLQKIYNQVDYDTTYISRSSGKMGLKAWGNLSGASLHSYSDNMRARLTTDVKGTLSLEFDYYDLALELALNPTTFTGRNHDYELNFNFYPRRFVFDVCYQKAETAAGSITYGGKHTDVERGWLDTQTLNVDAYYTFNNRHFSYDAPFYQFYVQKRSAGSWLAGVSFQGGWVRTTSAVPAGIPKTRIQTFHLGIGGGYAYNLMAGRKWLLHLSLTPNLIVWMNNHITMDGEKVSTNTKFPTVLMNARFGIVHYINPRHFIGMYGVSNSLIKRKSTTEFVNDKWIVRLFYGMRF